jgi:hypothetical protein
VTSLRPTATTFGKPTVHLLLATIAALIALASWPNARTSLLSIAQLVILETFISL